MAVTIERSSACLRFQTRWTSARGSRCFSRAVGYNASTCACCCRRSRYCGSHRAPLDLHGLVPCPVAHITQLCCARSQLKSVILRNWGKHAPAASRWRAGRGRRRGPTQPCRTSRRMTDLACAPGPRCHPSDTEVGMGLVPCRAAALLRRWGLRCTAAVLRHPTGARTAPGRCSCAIPLRLGNATPLTRPRVDFRAGASISRKAARTQRLQNGGLLVINAGLDPNDFPGRNLKIPGDGTVAAFLAMT